MKKSLLITSGVVAASVLAGAIALMSSSSPEVTIVRSDRESPSEILPGTANPVGQVAIPKALEPARTKIQRLQTVPLAPPRELIVKAQQSGSAQDAYDAVQGIRACSVRSGTGKRVRELLHESGVKLPPERLGALMDGIDKPERACQELDAAMLAEYGPFIRRAMNGGIEGAAAQFWVGPEGKLLKTPAGEDKAIDLLRRDALNCDKQSLLTYQVVSWKFSSEFNPTEVAAVEAASKNLEQQGKLRGNKAISMAKSFATPTNTVKAALQSDAVKATSADILRACDSPAS